MGWQDKKQVKKGNIGEDIVLELLEKRGYIVYSPKTDGSHKIDYFAHNGSSKNVICCEVKTKRRMARYDQTGFNVSAYEHYNEMLIKHNIRTFVFFVDDFEGCIYGNWLDELGDGNIKGSGRDRVIVFNLSNMKMICELNEDVVNQISKFTTEKYDYKNTKKYFNG
jgi:Holliday junction resolvase-like predicted endonuclease